MTMTDPLPPAPTNAPAPTTARETAHWTGADPASRWLAIAADLRPALAAGAAEADASGEFVADAFVELRARGLVSMLVPSELGGGGATLRETCAVLAELAHGCPSTSLALSMHSHLVAAQVWRHLRDLPAPALAKVAGNQALLISTGAADWLESNGTSVQV